MTAFIHHLAYDFKTGIRDRSKLMMFYLFPIVFFLLIGGLMSSLNPGFKQTMVPGMVVFAFMCSTLLLLPGVLVNARETGVFRSYRINGIPAGSIVSIPVVSTAVHMVVVAVLITFLGMRVYSGVAPSQAAGFVVAGLLSYLMWAGIGILIGVAAGNTTVSMLVAQIIYIPSIMLGGLIVPTSILPAGLRRISLLLPATHSTRVFVGLGMPDSPGTPWLSLGVIAASIVISFGLSALLFEWDSRAQAPSRKAWAALLAMAPFVAAALIGA